MHKSNYSLEVLINGRPAQEYYKDAKSFIESREGSEYTLRFRNNSWKRVMAIFSVDGIETLKGKAAAEADNGYIVDAFASIEIKGYRIDDKNVAAFKFSDVARGYNVTVGAASVDQATGETTYDKSARNSGVIGVRVVEEAGEVLSQYTVDNVGQNGVFLNQMSLGSTADLVAAAAPTFDTSTTWGAKLEDKVKEVSFKRSTNVTDLEVYYASRASLAAFGIDFEKTKQIFAWPSAFEDKKQYCKVPPGWASKGGA